MFALVFEREPLTSARHACRRASTWVQIAGGFAVSLASSLWLLFGLLPQGAPTEPRIPTWQVGFCACAAGRLAVCYVLCCALRCSAIGKAWRIVRRQQARSAGTPRTLSADRC